MTRLLAILCFGALTSFLLACGGSGAIGESCDTPGETESECDEGAVCDDTEGGDTLCLQVCEEHEDCAADEACNGVTGSDIKACHPKDDDDGGDDGLGLDDDGSGKDK